MLGAPHHRGACAVGCVSPTFSPRPSKHTRASTHCHRRTHRDHHHHHNACAYSLFLFFWGGRYHVLWNLEFFLRNLAVIGVRKPLSTADTASLPSARRQFDTPGPWRGCSAAARTPRAVCPLTLPPPLLCSALLSSLHSPQALCLVGAEACEPEESKGGILDTGRTHDEEEDDVSDYLRVRF